MRYLFHTNNSANTPFSERFAENKRHNVVFDRFDSENGDELINYKVGYRVFGQPNAKRDNIILVFHALTGDANCGGYYDNDGYVSGWWDVLFSEKGIFDRRKYCVICPNHPSSCYGSIGPGDMVVGKTKPIGPDFPALTVKDIAKTHYQLMQWLGIEHLYCLIGGSFGGMIVSEFIVNYPQYAKSAVMIAAPIAHNAQALALNHIQRECIENDPNYNQGQYYAESGPNSGLSLARQVGMISYRHSGEFDERFGRTTQYSENEKEKYFQIQSYLEYQGQKLINRFDANSYIKLTRVMDTHDLSHGRESFQNALSHIRCNLLLVAIDSDILYPPEEVRQTAELCQESGVNCQFSLIRSIHGHDGFLIEFEQLNHILDKFFKMLEIHEKS